MQRDIVQILGFGVDTFTFEEALEYITSHHGQVVTINPEMIETARKNSEFAGIINSSEMVLPDGIGVQLGLKILGKDIKRIAGIEFGKALLFNAAKEDKKVALIGAKEEVLIQAILNLKEEIPNLNIVYSHNGYFDNDTEILEDAVKTQPDVVLVALGSPKQEFFINQLKLRLPNSVLIGLGGSFDVWAGAVKRAPKIYQQLGLEWLYRTLKEPQRFKRIFPTLPVFVLRVLKERFIGK